MHRISRNRAKCLKCDEVVESHHRHDFRTCKCGNLSVDGGLDYLKRSAKDMKAIKEMSDYVDFE